MSFDLLVRGGTVVLPDTDGVAADLAIGDGRIAAILAPGTQVDARASLDASGKTVLPGAIDVHLHLGHGKDIARPRVPEDAATETAAAALGGITTFIPYLMATDPFEALFDEVRAVTEAGTRIDFGYHFIISTEAQLAGVPRYAREFGAPSFKIFMNNRGGEGARLGLPDIDDGFLLRLCEAAAANGGMVCPHPENIEAALVLRKRVMDADPQGRGGLRAWNATRPPFVEADAVQRAALFARATGARLYVVHTSSRAALEAGLRARDAGTDIRIETCPHYLTHDVDWAGGDLGKINPPLRARGDCDALWAGIIAGDVDTVATDHVHRDIAAKDGGIWKASPGCAGLETLLPVMLTEGHHQRGIPLGRIAALLASAPADAMGLRHRKGRIAVGLDADLAIVDLDRRYAYDRADVRSSAGFSIYEGREFTGKVLHTLVRGRFVVRDGATVEAAVGTGRYMQRAL
ncbi:MAG TPA: amidohydrolase family protein [Xanthobacteraceae bacterium]|nr:amidohydrolase family protein [Xanthobacteraceae bacterium]